MGKHGSDGNPNDGQKQPIGPLQDPKKGGSGGGKKGN